MLATHKMGGKGERGRRKGVEKRKEKEQKRGDKILTFIRKRESSKPCHPQGGKAKFVSVEKYETSLKQVSKPREMVGPINSPPIPPRSTNLASGQKKMAAVTKTRNTGEK